MRKLTIILLFFLVTFQLDCYSQSKVKSTNSTLERFQHSGFKSFSDYVQNNLALPPDVVSSGVEGVLLAGLQLDKNGKITNIFNLNSLHPSIDKIVLDVFSSSEEYWKPVPKSGSHRQDNIIIVPIVLTYGELEYELDRDNFKLPIADELTFTALGISKSNYKKTNKLLGKFYRLKKRQKYDKAYEIVNKLLKREPLNMQYYEALVKLEFELGKIESACQNLKFINSYFQEKTTLTVPDEYSCD